MKLNLVNDVPDGLTLRARSFVGAHGFRVDTWLVEEYRERWLAQGIPAAEIDRVAAYQERWGGLVLPPHWTPLHATVEGWVESLALARHASRWARRITRVTGDDVDDIVLDAYEPVSEVKGLADTWWRGTDSLVAVYSGEADCFALPRYRTALIYSGLDRWGLYGGVEDDEVEGEAVT